MGCTLGGISAVRWSLNELANAGLAKNKSFLFLYIFYIFFIMNVLLF